MSEEELKAIEYIKEFKNEVFEGVGNKSIMAKNIDILLNQVDKQQKEIEKLNFENHMVKKWNEQLDKNCISKDKIKEKIEHYNNELEHIKNGEEFENEEPMYYWGKVALEDLLEEK